MEREETQEILDDFIMRNDAELQRVNNQNPMLYDAVISALSYLSQKFGTGAQEQIDEINQKIETEAPIEKIAEQPISQISSENREEIVNVVEEELSISEIKAAMKSLKPLIEFDDDIKDEYNRLQTKLMKLKSKK